MTDRIRIAIIDDHPMFRAGLMATLRRFPDLKIAEFGATADDAIRLAGSDIDIMLLDIGIPGGGLSAGNHIVAQFPHKRIIYLTGSNSEDDAIAAMINGACGYMLKGTTGRELVEVIRLVHGGGRYFAPELALRALAGRNRTEPAVPPGPRPRGELTERETLHPRACRTGSEKW